jgi:hypothetical protein
MEKIKCRRVTPGNLTWADLASGDPIYIIDTSKYYSKTDTFVDRFGNVREKGRILRAPAIRALLDMYRGYTEDNETAAKSNFKVDKVATNVDSLFSTLMELEGVGINSATLICIAMKDRLPDLKHIYASQVHKELFVEFDGRAPLGRTGYNSTNEISTVIPRTNALRTATSMAGEVLDSLDLKGKPTKEEVATLATTERCTVLPNDCYIMDSDLYKAETTLMSMFTDEVKEFIKPDFDEYSEAGMSEDQFRAFKGILSSPRRVMCLQGCPGSGKSHVITAIDRFYRVNYGTRPLITSYMNKACLNLFQRIPDYSFSPLMKNPGVPTIHSIYYKILTMKEQKLPKPPMIIVDESSVLSSRILAMLLKIYDYFPNSRILFVGDANQLPPVCAYGTPFHNMMRRDDVLKFELSTFHRSNGDGIYALMKRLRDNGKVTIYRDADGGVFTHKVSNLDQACKLAGKLAYSITHGRGQRMKDFGVIAETNEIVRRLNLAMAAGHLGIDESELTVRQVKDSRKTEKAVLVPDRPGMRIIANDTIRDIDVHFSGMVAKNEFGEIVEYSGKRVVVNMDIGDREIVIDSAEKFHSVFGPGYASTVHKYQGSEAEEVMYVLENSANMHGNGFSSNKELKYVGLTRAKKKLDILAIENGVSGSLARGAIELNTRPLANALMCF